MFYCTIFFILTFTSVILTENSDWQGKWFPYGPREEDANEEINNHGHNYDHIKMGIIDRNCDDAKTNLDLDWYKQPENYTCYENKMFYLPKMGLHPIHTTENIPQTYIAPHLCMNESIHYSENLPTFGSHRPLWAVYGEYQFLPRQRWIHNLEHGAVVMLYHPCANKNQVQLLKKIVKMCLYRHIITPYNLLTPERPLALLTWGHRLEMSKVSLEVAVNFIKQHALKGPETNTKDGQYDLFLIQNAKIVSNINDIEICPVYGQDEVSGM